MKKINILLVACGLFAASFAQPINHQPHRLTILLDAGHGATTPGKRSPDGSFLEYAWNRDEVRFLSQCLSGLGFDVINIVPEASDVPIQARVRRVNTICDEHGISESLLVSLHCNAASIKSEWQDHAHGLLVFVPQNASEKSRRFAQMIFEGASQRGLLGNRFYPPCHYCTGDYGIIRDTKCPAVLLECAFMDHPEDLAFLKSERGKQTVVEMIVEAILAYKAEIGL